MLYKVKAVVLSFSMINSDRKGDNGYGNLVFLASKNIVACQGGGVSSKPPDHSDETRAKNPLVHLGGWTNPNLQGEHPTCWATKTPSRIHRDRLTDCIKYT